MYIMYYIVLLYAFVKLKRKDKSGNVLCNHGNIRRVTLEC